VKTEVSVVKSPVVCDGEWNQEKLKKKQLLSHVEDGYRFCWQKCTERLKRLQFLKHYLFWWLRTLTHAQETCTRNLRRFLAWNFDASSCINARSRAAFYSAFIAINWYKKKNFCKKATQTCKFLVQRCKSTWTSFLYTFLDWVCHGYYAVQFIQ